ncbi:MAG: hypothetical protein WEB53_07190 [Akkermansiaceae bacterium]
MCLSHALLSRARPDAAVLNSLAAAGFAGLFALLAFELAAFLSGQHWRDVVVLLFLVDGPIYACLAYGYANFVNLGHSSVRVRIYRELLSAPSGIPTEELRSRYDEAGMLSARLGRLVEGEDLVFDGSSYRLQKVRLLVISSTIFAMKKAVLGKTSEFSP